MYTHPGSTCGGEAKRWCQSSSCTCAYDPAGITRACVNLQGLCGTCGNPQLAHVRVTLRMTEAGRCTVEDLGGTCGCGAIQSSNAHERVAQSVSEAGVHDRVMLSWLHQRCCATVRPVPEWHTSVGPERE